MHTNVILTNKRRIHAQSNYTNTKLKAWFRRLLRHPPSTGNRVDQFYTPGATCGKPNVWHCQLTMSKQGSLLAEYY